MTIHQGIPFSYPSKFSKTIFIPKEEQCAITQSSLEDLYQKKLDSGLPHVLALVKDTQGGKNVYDGEALSDFFIRGERWKWLNPATRVPIKRVDYFAIKTLKEGYQLLKKIKVALPGSAQALEDLWFCSNMAKATDFTNPYAYHSLIAVSKHFEGKDAAQEAKWMYHLAQFISRSYGKGVSILLTPWILRRQYTFFEYLLFSSFDYKVFDALFTGSDPETFINSKGESLFKTDDLQKNLSELLPKICEVLKSKQTAPGSRFASFLVTADKEGSLTPPKDYVQDTDTSVSLLAQAVMLILNNPAHLKNLIQAHPHWNVGRAYRLYNHVEKASGSKCIEAADKLVKLCEACQDPLVIELFAKCFEDNQLSNPSWQPASYHLKNLNISRYRPVSRTPFASELYPTEPDTALSLLETNYALFDTYMALGDLSDMERKYGIDKQNKAIYAKGISHGISVLKAPVRHVRLMFTLGIDLLAEITPFRSTKEQEAIGIEAMLDALKRVPTHIIPHMYLSDYKIRKGTPPEAKAAHEWVLAAISTFPHDLELLSFSIRFHLRFSKTVKALEETVLPVLKKLTQDKPKFSLIKALWFCHPLRRSEQPDWFILASNHLKKAFAAADGSHIQFLLDNLSLYDKLSSDDQTKCKLLIADLLGYTI